MPFLYDDTQFLNLKALNEKGREALTKALQEMAGVMGFDLFNKFLFELKFDKSAE